MGTEPHGATGLDILWEVSGFVSNQPLVADSLVIVRHVNGRVVAYRVADGSVKWERRLPSEVWGTQLARFGEIVVVPAVWLYGLDLKTGATRWVFRGSGNAAGLADATLSGDTLYVPGYTGGDGSAISVRTGEEVWSVAHGGRVHTPVISGELAIFPTQDLPTGTPALRAPRAV